MTRPARAICLSHARRDFLPRPMCLSSMELDYSCSQNRGNSQRHGPHCKSYEIVHVSCPRDDMEASPPCFEASREVVWETAMAGKRKVAFWALGIFLLSG